MKFDMHCHTKEGSIDGQVSLDRYIRILKDKGFGGMLVTDHNSYDGYRVWKEGLREEHPDFVVLKGIEYDTSGAGHIIIIMPEGIKPRILEVRGLPVGVLAGVVHRYGGILGPAHPCGEKYLSISNTRQFQKNEEIMEKFDFVETFNACETQESNEEARKLALKYWLPGFGGSDAHKASCVGLAFTELPDSIRTESDLIAYVKKKRPIRVGGTRYMGTTKEKIGKANDMLLYSFWVYNKAAMLMKGYARRKKMHKVG